MDKDRLARDLEAGRAIESIAREAGKHPSTVAYWAQKFGLESVHAEKHRPRGGLSREQLEPLVNSGMTICAMAEQLGVGTGMVRRWLAKHGLKTVRGARRIVNLDELALLPDGDLMSVCPKHGRTRFRARRDQDGWRCLACRMEYVDSRRRRMKAQLVREAGGSCRLCGYRRTLAALQFHHLDPAAKEFNVSQAGVWRSVEAARVEARKCILLCANCHAEVEAGAATITANPVSNPPG